MAHLLALPRAAERLQNGAGFNKNLEQTGGRIGKSGLSATKSAVGKNARAYFANMKSNRAVSENEQIVKLEKVSVDESLSLAVKRKVRARTWNRKSQLYTSKKGEFQEENGGYAERASWRKKEKS